ncbi:MAG: hypothetical protein HY898_21110 [Deltaproteobacteria bacterium]|nr:hypothetical protein [Deltaproteobacteria bacterium]
MRALVLNSTQPKHPHGGLPWVGATLGAIEELASQKHSFIASVGTLAWELALWKIAAARAPVHVLCPIAHAQDEEEARLQIERDFDIDPALATWRFLRSEKRSERLKDTWLRRDAAAIDAAERIFPISIRSKGKMHLALQSSALRDRIDGRYQIPYERDPEARPWQLPAQRALASPGMRMLLHFTRSCDTPWPGESRARFYAAIAKSSGRYPRDAFSTLVRIVDERCIRASTFRIRGRGATVSFTALDPADALSLVRWRSRYARFAFEPYAVGISWEAAVRAGAQPVVYDPGAARTLEGTESVLHQGRGEAGGWEAEQEWRIEGNVDLAALDPSEVVVLTATATEADSLRCRWPFQVRDLGCTPAL